MTERLDSQSHGDKEHDAMMNRQQEWNSLDKAIREYVAGYEMRGDGFDHTPDAGERLLIVDCINGLLAEDDFLDAIAKVFPVRTRVTRICRNAHRRTLPKARLSVRCSAVDALQGAGARRADRNRGRISHTLSASERTDK